jgi:hypothetical protein
MFVKHEADFPYIRKAVRHERYSMFEPIFNSTFSEHKLLNYSFEMEDSQKNPECNTFSSGLLYGNRLNYICILDREIKCRAERSAIKFRCLVPVDNRAMWVDVCHGGRC